MKGRGARTIDAADFQAVTPDAEAKDRFVIVDAVGVTEADLVEAVPLNRHSERQISLRDLLKKAGTLTADPDEVATLAARLARLDQQLTDAERAELADLAGQPLTGIVRGLVDAVAPEQLNPAREAGPGAVRTCWPAPSGRWRRTRRCGSASWRSAGHTTSPSTR